MHLLQSSITVFDKLTRTSPLLGIGDVHVEIKVHNLVDTQAT